MADRAVLGILGIAFGGITLAVMLMAAVVVKGHIDGRLSLDATARQVATASLPATVH